MEKFKNKYRIPSNRKPNYDYSANGLYFITICTQHRICNLGEIVGDDVDIHGHEYQRHEYQRHKYQRDESKRNESQRMALSDFGKIVDIEWNRSFEIRQELILHEYIIMPNHLHAIVEIFKNDEIKNENTDHIENDKDDNANLEIGTEIIIPDDGALKIKRNPPVRLPKSISSFIGGFKSAVNTKIDDFIDEHDLQIPKYNRQNHFFQPNYHDHIIRNKHEYERIKNYIINNPDKWNQDKLRKQEIK